MTNGITINRNDVAAVESLLSDIKNGAVKALVTAINKTATTTKVQVKKRLGQELNLKASRINQDLSIKKANYGNISGRVVATGEPIGLINFGATQKKTWAGTKVKVLKTSIRKTLKHAFIATVKGTPNVWWRALGSNGKRVGRLPIERLTGPRIEDILSKDEILTPINEDAANLLTENLDKKIEEILRRHG